MIFVQNSLTSFLRSTCGGVVELVTSCDRYISSRLSHDSSCDHPASISHTLIPYHTASIHITQTASISHTLLSDHIASILIIHFSSISQSTSMSHTLRPYHTSCPSIDRRILHLCLNVMESNTGIITTGGRERMQKFSCYWVRASGLVLRTVDSSSRYPSGMVLMKELLLQTDSSRGWCWL